MALRLLHFADLHLDRSFASQRLFGSAAQRRRADLRAALTRVTERARLAECDLITCGGDLFDQDHVTRETGAFLLDTLKAAGRPVLIAPGQSDPPLAGSPYRYLRWPENVTIASQDDLRPYTFGGVTIWSAGRPQAVMPRVQGRGQLLLLHGCDPSLVAEGADAYGPIRAHEIEQAGFAHALLGHHHQAQTSRWRTYPGSPEPLGWDDPGPHCTALVTIGDDGEVAVRLEPVNERAFAEETVDVTGFTHRDQIREAVHGLRAGKHLEGDVVRIVFIGVRERTLDLDRQALELECGDGFAHLEFRDQSRSRHDLESLADEFTSRGEMLRQLVQHRNGSQEDDTVGRAIQLALDAFEA